MIKISGPLFKWFGSKWLSSKLLPKPKYESIIEPFGGSASYSLRYNHHDVSLYESDEHIYELWKWLITEATEALIRAIPIGIPEGTDVRGLGLEKGQALLLKNWQRTNNIGNCWTISPWGNKPGQWTANTRARISEEFAVTKHWKLSGRNGLVAFNNSEATWFIDPPYQYNYRYKSPKLDYVYLGEKVKKLRGQIVACEAICPKTGTIPDYLPFQYFGERITSRRKSTNNHHSKELIYHADC